MDRDELKSVLEAALGPFKDDIKNLQKAQNDMGEQIKARDEKAASKEDLTDINARLKDTSEQLGKHGECVTELQRKLARNGLEEKSPGQIIVEQKDFADTVRRRGELEVKDVTTQSFDAQELQGGLRRESRGMIEPVTQQLFLRDVIPSSPTNAAVIEYLGETGYTNNAAIVAEGKERPKSELTFAPKKLTIEKIGHEFQVSEETLDDVDRMQAYIEQRGIYGLKLKEEGFLINHTNADNELNGLRGASVDYKNTTVPGIAPQAAMDDVRVAIAQVAESDLVATAVVMNHLDAAALDLQKDADGHYLHPAFLGNTAWGLPVVRTRGLKQGEFIVAGFVGNAIIWQRKALTIKASSENKDNFSKDMYTIAVSERLNMEILRPEGIVFGKLSNQSTAAKAK